MARNIDVFAPTDLARIAINNRIIRSATDEGMADENGAPTELFMKTYKKLADGGVGCIITTYMGVIDGAVPMHNMILIDSDEKMGKLSELVDLVHSSGCPIISQIAHAGTHSISGKVDISKIDVGEIRHIRDAFVSAAIRASRIGFDGVQIHCAHGYFLSECLSPHTNKRKDDWGGSEENRFRILAEIVQGIRAELPDYPVFVKMNGSERAKNGIKPETAVSIAKRMEAVGIDGIEVSCSLGEGMGPMHGDAPVDMMFDDYPSLARIPKFLVPLVKPIIRRTVKVDEPRKLYNLPATKLIRDAVSIPVIAVGGIHDLSEIEEVINDHGIDYVAMSRPLILEPDLISKYRSGKSHQSKCIHCNCCIIGVHQRPLKCYYGRG